MVPTRCPEGQALTEEMWVQSNSLIHVRHWNL